MKNSGILSSLPDLIKDVVKQTLESIMVAERETFIKENGGSKK
ncbi:MAG: hypothetical protein Q9M37_09235 [Desulfonauticus sp.]|nr:hypothetical protein [Desulfonauticus sp.]